MRRSIAVGSVVGILGLVLAPRASLAEDGERGSCEVTDVQYDVSATLVIRGTTMGAGDGQHAIGPGKVVLRFDTRREHDGVRLLTYDLREHFTVVAKALLWATQVTTRLDMHAGLSRTVALGKLTGRTVRWDGEATDVRSDGTLACEGSMCGKFGAPEAGFSQVHSGPGSMELKAFEFSADMKTFVMPFALVSKSESPRQETRVSLAGREVRRSCVAPPPGE